MTETEEDDIIQKKVCNALFRDRLLDARAISIDVTDGVVTLRGNVPDRKAKAYAEAVLENIYGVLEVKNRLSVHADKGLVGDMNWPI